MHALEPTSLQICHQAHEVIFIIRNLIEKASEWQDHICVLDGDLHKAYDYTKHSLVITALRRRNVPDILTAGWIREIRRMKFVFVLGPDIQSGQVVRRRSLLEGDPAAPDLFNATLDVPATEFLQ